MITNPSSTEIRPPRNRVVVSVCLMVTIALGLATRRYATVIPPFIASHAGDALWTVAAYFTMALIRPRTSILRLGFASFGVSAMVELSQLLELQWLAAIRATQIGHLFLGASFLWLDLVRYLFGAILAMRLDRMLTPRRWDSPVRG